MNILVDIGHPAHVHFFKNAIRIWREHGHEVSVTARRIPVAMRLLDACGIKFDVVSEKRKGALGLGVELIEHTARLLPHLRRRKIDATVSVGGTFTVFASRLSGRRCFVCYDTETATIANRITFPFATAILTPACYPNDLGRRHVRYRGFHALSHLHTAYFKPDPAVPARYSLPEDRPFSVVRLSSWEASHDLGVTAMSLADKRRLIEKLKEFGPVVVVPEGAVPPELADLAVPIRPEDFPNLLYYAAFCLTEGATTAAEACVLGTPALYINPIRPVCLCELTRYGLLELAGSAEEGMDAMARLRQRFGDKAASRGRARDIAADCEDVTAFVVDYVERHGRRDGRL